MKSRNLAIVLINLVLLAIFGVYYSHERKELDAWALYQRNIEQKDSLKIQTIEKNDTTAYNRLRIMYINKPDEGKLLFYSIVLANKCHYPQAYYDVYHELRFLENMERNKRCSNKETRKLMIHYLTKGAKLGHQPSIYELGKL